MRIRTATRLLAGLLLLPAPMLLAQEQGGAPAAPVATPSTSPAEEVPVITPAPAASPAAPETPSATPEATPAAATPTPTPAPAKAVPPPAPPTAREITDALSDTDVKQALELIRASYVDPTEFTDEALNRATLQGLLERLGSGAGIEESHAAAESSPLRAEILDDRIGYVRMGSLSADSLAEFDAALENFKSKSLRSLIIDFRATPASGNYELAAEYIKRLSPKGKMLFALRRPNNKQELMFTSSFDPAFDGVVVSVVNRHTAGAAEVIAAVLREVSNALVVGQTTAGQAAEFTHLPLRGGKQVRVAVGEVNLPGDREIFPSGLKPDLAVRIAPKVEAEVLQTALEKGVGGLVFERERPRLNEAALVAGENPELEEYAARPDPSTGRRIFDRALQRAVDLITTISIFAGERGKN